MKSVLISIKPRWCELIASGEKKIEVRKTRPKIDAPFKCYIYCTKEHNESDRIYFFDHNQRPWCNPTLGNGKVIGEFVCDCIDEDLHGEFTDYFERCGCVTRSEQIEYAGNKTIFGWHIADLVIYDKPKELSEFGLNRAPQSWCFVEEVAK